MTVKEFLRDIKRKTEAIKLLKEQLERLRCMAEYKSPTIDEIGGGHGTRDPHQRENLIVRISEISMKLDSLIEEMVEDMDKATEMILSLSDDKTMRVFSKRYLDFKTWERIADEMDITFQWVHELHKRGLIELSKKYPDFSEK